MTSENLGLVPLLRIPSNVEEETSTRLELKDIYINTAHDVLLSLRCQGGFFVVIFDRRDLFIYLCLRRFKENGTSKRARF